VVYVNLCGGARAYMSSKMYHVKCSHLLLSQHLMTIAITYFTAYSLVEVVEAQSLGTSLLCFFPAHYAMLQWSSISPKILKIMLTICVNSGQ